MVEGGIVDQKNNTRTHLIGVTSCFESGQHSSFWGICSTHLPQNRVLHAGVHFSILLLEMSIYETNEF